MDGKVGVGLENSLRETDVKLKMSTDVLDGMFTGRITTIKAATGGKLSYSGDTGKAMSFIRIQNNMSRLYSAARNKIGDPGDQSKLGVVPTNEPTSFPATSNQTVPQRQAVTNITIPGVMKTGDVRDQILMVTNELFA